MKFVCVLTRNMISVNEENKKIIFLLILKKNIILN